MNAEIARLTGVAKAIAVRRSFTRRRKGSRSFVGGKRRALVRAIVGGEREAFSRAVVYSFKYSRSRRVCMRLTGISVDFSSFIRRM